MGLLGLAAASAVVFVLLAVLTFVWDRSTRSPRHDEVLPSHYSALLEFDHTRYPGHCPACGTDNEPGYRFCQSCGEPIPTTDGSPTDADIGWIVDG